MADLYHYHHPITNKHSPMISKETFDIITANAEVSACIIRIGYNNNYTYMYISHKHLFHCSLAPLSCVCVCVCVCVCQVLDSAIIYDRDFNYQFFGFKTLERSYLLKIDSKSNPPLCGLAPLQ